jgi:hypothetical protein
LPTVAAPEPSPPPPPEIDNVEDDDYDPAEDEILTKQSECPVYRVFRLTTPHNDLDCIYIYNILIS